MQIFLFLNVDWKIISYRWTLKYNKPLSNIHIASWNEKIKSIWASIDIVTNFSKHIGDNSTSSIRMNFKHNHTYNKIISHAITDMEQF